SARFSPNLKFLKNARSLLKIDGIRTAFRDMFPICPVANGLAKQLTLKALGVPVESTPKSPCIGSQVMNGRALMPPPVKSVIGVQVCVVAVVAVTLDPTGHCCPREITAAVLEYVAVIFF